MTLTWGQILPYAGALARAGRDAGAGGGGADRALGDRRRAGGGAAGGRRRRSATWSGRCSRMLGIGVVAGVWAELPDGAALCRGGDPGLMGVQLIRRAEAAGLAVAGGGLGRESGWAAFSAGLMVIAGNPKAILFYMGVLPGFFDFRRLTPLDMAVICLVSVLVPFARQPRLGGALRAGAAVAGRPGGDAADACGGRGGAGGGGGGDCGGVVRGRGSTHRRALGGAARTGFTIGLLASTMQGRD